MNFSFHKGPERIRLTDDMGPNAKWRRWGPYLSERQWSTVREDYSATGEAWEYFPHDHARSRVYRWGEDGLLGITDRRCRMCFALALWNEHDPILKERLFGVTGNEGNHGEDVKEYYFYLDAAPTASYLKALYKYPQAEYPYARLVEENRRRDRGQPEFELADTGIFDDNRYFDVFVEYAKATPEDILIRITVCNRGPEAAPLHLLPTLWFRNTWDWGRTGDDYWARPRLWQIDEATIRAEHESLGSYLLTAAPAPNGTLPPLLFTDNATNRQRLWGVPNTEPYVKDAFHRYVVNGEHNAVNPAATGTKAAPWYRLRIPAGGQTRIELRLSAAGEAIVPRFGPSFDGLFAQRKLESEQFWLDMAQWLRHAYGEQAPQDGSTSAPLFSEEQFNVLNQAKAGLIWSCQYYQFIVDEWLEGDPAQPPPPPRQRLSGRNHDWTHLYCRDVMSMPDKWEYPGSPPGIWLSTRSPTWPSTRTSPSINWSW